MKKFLWPLLALIVLLSGFLYLIKNPQSSISQKLLPMIWFEKTLTWEVVSIANPASVFCLQNRGTSEILEWTWWQYWVCHLSDWTTCEERAYFRWECSISSEKTATETKENIIKKIVLRDKEWIKILDIDSNTLEAINSTQELLIPDGIDSTPIKYLYFIDDKWIWFFDIINNIKKIDGLSLTQTCNKSIYCNKVIRSFSDVNSFLVVGWNEDEWGAFNIISWYIYDINSDTKQYLTKEIISSIWWRGCELTYNGINKIIYNLWCDGDNTRLSININNNTIENINFLHQDDYYKAWWFFFWYDRSKDNKVINLEILDMFENKTYKPNINTELPLAYEYYFNKKDNILIQLWESNCIYLNSNSLVKKLNVEINNFASVLDSEKWIIYLTTKNWIKSVNIKSCEVEKTIWETIVDPRIEWYISN